jgi:hypothetical protein
MTTLYGEVVSEWEIVEGVFEYGVDRQWECWLYCFNNLSNQILLA